jgi:hypothetical protein
MTRPGLLKAIKQLSKQQQDETTQKDGAEEILEELAALDHVQLWNALVTRNGLRRVTLG